jgi:hypothetical protein
MLLRKKEEEEVADDGMKKKKLLKGRQYEMIRYIKDNIYFLFYTF